MKNIVICLDKYEIYATASLQFLGKGLGKLSMGHP